MDGKGRQLNFPFGLAGIFSGVNSLLNFQGVDRKQPVYRIHSVQVKMVQVQPSAFPSRSEGVDA